MFPIPSLSTILAILSIIGVACLGLYFWWSQDEIATLKQNVIAYQTALQEEKKTTDDVVQKMKDLSSLMTNFNDQVSKIQDNLNKKNEANTKIINSTKTKTPVEITQDANKMISDQIDNLTKLSK